jgi:hypothetical protein
MGCIYSTPIPPPNPHLIGTWILNPESLNYNSQVGDSRYSNKYICSTLPHKICKLIITKEGWMSYMESISSHSMKFIDGPILKWNHGAIKSSYGSKILLNDDEINANKIMVNGNKLYKYLQS